MTPTIGILRPGSTFEGMVERFGDYDAWFTRALEPTGARILVHDVTRSAPPAPADADAWIITGSRSSVVRPEPWAERLLGWIGEAAARGVPILGVCYGHQAVCAALGGRVARHAGGWEIGTVEVELTEAGRADPLFAGFPDRFLVQTTHEDEVTALPPGADLLASNSHSEIQATAAGRAIRTVQFHPEVTASMAADFVERRRALVDRDVAVMDAPHAGRVLANFVAGFVAGAAAER